MNSTDQLYKALFREKRETNFFDGQS